MKRALLIIAKRPAKGQTKTRLSPALSLAQATGLYECFLRDMLLTAQQVPNVTRLINYWPLDERRYFEQLAPDFDLLPQQGDNLGQRLNNVLSTCLEGEFQQAVITNSDSPTLPAGYLAQAFDRLNTADVVLGPCDDGGYYLIGLNKPRPRLLLEVQMSTATVLRDTLALAREEGLKTALLPPWFDIDTAADVNRLTADLARQPDTIAPHTRRFLQTLKPSSEAV